MIPKIIHYCWFSNDPFPVEVKLCLDTWKRVLPDYKLRIWKLDDALSLKCTFVNEALKCKKWAFAADVVRIYALYTEGGVYMDCDIFLKKRFDDFVCGDFATFCECSIDGYLTGVERKEGEEVPFGLQAAFMIGAKNNHFCKLILDYYYSHNYTLHNAEMDMRIAPYIYAEVAESLGFEYINKKQELSSNTFVFDSKFLGMTKREFCDETFGVHRISHSWKSFNDYPFFKRIEKKIRHYIRVVKYNCYQGWM